MALDGGKWAASRSGRFIPRVSVPGTHWDRKLVGPQSQSGRGGEKKKSQNLLGTELRSFSPTLTLR